MTNADTLKENFSLLKTYKKVGKSAEHVDTIMKCNSAANGSAIGEIDDIVIKPSDEVVIVRSSAVAARHWWIWVDDNAGDCEVFNSLPGAQSWQEDWPGKIVRVKEILETLEFEVREYKRKSNYNDGEAINSEQ